MSRYEEHYKIMEECFAKIEFIESSIPEGERTLSDTMKISCTRIVEKMKPIENSKNSFLKPRKEDKIFAKAKKAEKLVDKIYQGRAHLAE